MITKQDFKDKLKGGKNSNQTNKTADTPKSLDSLNFQTMPSRGEHAKATYPYNKNVQDCNVPQELPKGQGVGLTIL